MLTISLRNLLTLFLIYFTLFSLVEFIYQKGAKMATIEKRTSSEGKISYRVKIRIKGFPDQTATFTKLSLAKDWVARTETKIKDGKYLSEIQARKYTVSEIIDRYKKTVLIHKKSIQQDWTSQLNWWDNKIGQYTLSAANSPRPSPVSQIFLGTDISPLVAVSPHSLTVSQALLFGCC